MSRKPRPAPRRPSATDGRCVVVGISLPGDVLAAIDTARAYEPRSSFIARQLRRALKLQPAEPHSRAA